MIYDESLSPSYRQYLHSKPLKPYIHYQSSPLYNFAYLVSLSIVLHELYRYITYTKHKINIDKLPIKNLFISYITSFLYIIVKREIDYYNHFSNIELYISKHVISSTAMFFQYFKWNLTFFATE